MPPSLAAPGSHVGERVDGIVIALLRSYQRLLSPLFAGLGSQCRFEPSCSQYMIDAVRMRGAAFGVGLGLWRLARCNPLNAGGYDPATPRRRTLVERDVSRET